MAMKMKLKVSESGMKNIQYNKSVKQRATHKRLYRTERLRKLSGLQQKTGMLINLFPKRIQNVVNKYICVRKYFHCEGEPFDVLYYDENTKRTSHESIMSARYGIKFVQYDDGKNETELI